jgi:hypothetical protein
VYLSVQSKKVQQFLKLCFSTGLSLKVSLYAVVSHHDGKIPSNHSSTSSAGGDANPRCAADYSTGWGLPGYDPCRREGLSLAADVLVQSFPCPLRRVRISEIRISASRSASTLV